MKYNPTIGLEIHAELKTNSKMFCSCKNDPDEQTANKNVCPVCLAHPGTLPVANKDAIEKVIKVGLALGGKIALKTKFDRKNYFYPDLPKGYQISQYDMPIVEGGQLVSINITRVHLEEDTGSSMHPKDTDYSLVNFNRAGVPLMELVTEPEITSGEQARKFAQELQLILRYLHVSEASMEKGQMRVEVNISMRAEGTDTLGTKVEIKNLNSFRAVEQSATYEIKRQIEALEKGEQIVQETRGWNESRGETFSQRVKESAHDYRYFPEPDLPPFSFTKKKLELMANQMPELPSQRRKRFGEQYGVSDEMFILQPELGDFFEKVASELNGEHIQLAVNYITSDLQGMLTGKNIKDENLKVTPENFAELIMLLAEKKISTPAAKAVLRDMFETGADPTHIIGEKGLEQMSDESEIETIAKKIITDNPQAVADYKAGKEQSLKFLVGQLMAQTRGAANPQTATQILQTILTKDIL